MSGKRLVVVWSVIGVLGTLFVVLLIGSAVAVRKGLNPVSMAGDTLTGYGRNAPRHRNAKQLPSPWDPVGDWNKRVEATPPGDRAFPVLAEIAARLRVIGDTTEGAAPGQSTPDFIDARPGDEGWDDLVAWLGRDDVGVVLDRIEEAARRPRMASPMLDRDSPEWIDAMAAQGITIAPDPSPVWPQQIMIHVMLPGLGPERLSTRVLFARARLAAETGDSAGFCRIVETGVALGLKPDRTPFLIDRLVLAADLMMMHGVVAETLRDRPDLIDEASAVRLDAAMARGADALMGGAAEAYAGESVMLEDILRRMVDSRGVFDPVRAHATSGMLDGFTSGAAPSPSSVERGSINAELLAVYERHAAQIAARRASLEIPWRAVAADAAQTPATPRLRSIPDAIAAQVLTLFDLKGEGGVPVFRTAYEDLVGLRVALAAHRHTLRHGALPASLDDIDPDLLAFDPVDGFTGGRLFLRLTDAGVVVYAAGADGDDDGGRRTGAKDDEDKPLRTITDAYLEAGTDGDWVCFPLREP